MVMQLVDEGRIDLDQSVAAYLSKPLPEYPFYESLKGDERWRTLTPRILLSHTSGLANFAFLEPDQKMRFHFDPVDLSSCASGPGPLKSAGPVHK